jgi:hypothetical protein
MQGDQHVAFLEDSRLDRTLKIKVGDSVGKGKITAITINGIQYQRDEKTREIKIGYTLSGSSEVSRSSSSYRRSYSRSPSSTRSSSTDKSTSTKKSPSAEEPPSTATTENTGEPEASSRPAEPEKPAGAESLLERMRKRRQQELEK